MEQVLIRVVGEIEHHRLLGADVVDLEAGIGICMI